MVLQPPQRFAKCIQVLARVETSLERYALVGLLVVLGLYYGVQVRADGWNLWHWDLLFISGIVTFMLALALARRMPGRFDAMLDRLVHRGVLALTPEALVPLKQELAGHAARWARRSGVVVSAALLLGTGVAFGLPLPPIKLGLALLEAVGGYLAGRQLGTMAAYGGLGWLLQAKHIPVVAQPGHLDGAAGLKPVGRFYFAQAMLAAIPAIFLAVWCLLIPVWPGRSYAQWRASYLGLLALALGFEILIFVVPLWAFHVAMQARKRELLETADSLSRQIAQAEDALAASQDEHERSVLKDRLAYMTQHYWNIETMPSWPLDTTTRRRFTLNNVLLFVPLISQSLGVTGVWQQMIKQVVDLFSK